MKAVRETSLHVFCDSSQDTYGVCACLRQEFEDTTVECRLVAGKGRVAPLKTQSICRLELTGALLAARLAETLATELTMKIEKIIFRSDSTTVLHWIGQTSSNYKVFVGKRVSEIHTIMSELESTLGAGTVYWRYVPTECNPADNVTRGLRPAQLDVEGYRKPRPYHTVHDNPRSCIVHGSYYHPPTEYLLNQIRQEYWIIRGRQAVRSAKFKCNYCYRQTVKPLEQKMGNLPECRLEVGMHIVDDVDDLKECSVIILINGTNFIGTNDELRKCLKQLDEQRIQNVCARKEIDRKFHPQSAPHFGGAWERLVQCTEKTLKALLKDRVFPKEALRTVLVETEGILNSRPISHVSSDAGDIEALIPNHLLLLRANPSYEDAVVTDREVNSTKLWRQSQALAKFSWRGFTKECLTSLTERKKWKENGQNLKVGDAVLVSEPNQ
ncbi:uncharacterized protein [Montipora capricornis]|uniref:uncharacterized protein n=1 Tax=Montipora capricornis TaxID=246305 RepID=UPI0035F17E71